jgi:hypothetical protein
MAAREPTSPRRHCYATNRHTVGHPFPLLGALDVERGARDVGTARRQATPPAANAIRGGQRGEFEIADCLRSRRASCSPSRIRCSPPCSRTSTTLDSCRRPWPGRWASCAATCLTGSGPARTPGPRSASWARRWSWGWPSRSGLPRMGQAILEKSMLPDSLDALIRTAAALPTLGLSVRSVHIRGESSRLRLLTRCGSGVYSFPVWTSGTSSHPSSARHPRPAGRR